MQISIKIVGNELFDSLMTRHNALQEAFPQSHANKADHLQWHIECLPHRLRPENLLSYPDSPSVLLIDAGAPGFIDKIRLMEKRELSYIKNPPFLPIVLSPIILVFHKPSELDEIPEFPDIVTDWICMPLCAQELIRRIMASLRQKNIIKSKLRFGALALQPESRMMCFGSKSIHLTPSEFVLAEMFLSQPGAVISLPNLTRLFKASGKSTEGSNIRVTVFQLRLKLEMLTRSRYSLVSIYKQGYCLKMRPKNAAAAESDSQTSSA